jgi:hypothetical protein
VAACDICGGQGVVEHKGKLYECECAELRRIAAAMPTFIRMAPVLEAHLKATLPDGRTRIMDAIGRSLFLTCYQADMRAFVKLIMIKYDNRFVRITSDREIRDVYVGSTSQKARGEFSKEPIYNNIEDLVKAPDLLIIRLNELKSKNKAAAGALEEAICYRLDRKQPLWMISDKRDPFHDSSYAWSETVSAILRSLIQVRVDAILPDNYVSPPPTSLESSPLAPEFVHASMDHPKRASVSPSPTPPTVSLKGSKQIRSVPDDVPSGFEAFGQGVKKNKRFS